MTAAYPSARTGTAQDLMRVVTKAYEERLAADGTVLPAKPRLQRLFLEPLTRLFGMAIAVAMELVPADWTVAFHNKLFTALSGGKSYPFDPANVASAKALAATLEEPALLAAISHPPVMGELAHLNFELVRHSTLALREVRGRACRPRLVVAVDPFALDTISVAEEGIYAGFMGSFHYGIDRLAYGRGMPGPALTPWTRWDRMPQRLFAALRAGGEVGMVLSGGVPATGRVLYGVREWARRLRSASAHRLDAKKSLSCLRADPAFAAFEKAVEGKMHLSDRPWRLVEAWLMAAGAGLVPGTTAEKAGAAALSSLGVPEAERPALLAALGESMTRETPSRRRLFRLLVGRAARVRPVVLLPIVHSSSPLGVAEREAWAIKRAGPGRVAVARASAPSSWTEMSADELADRFTKENFA